MTFTTLTTQDRMRSVVTVWCNAVDDEKFSFIEAARVAGQVTDRRRR